MSITDTGQAAAVVPAVVARGLSMRGRWGPLFGPVDLDVAAGGVTVLVGPTGLGCTALLLTLAGRMRPATGVLTVFGHGGAWQIFRLATAAALGDIDALDQFTTVGDVITEQMRWNAEWYRIVRAAGTGEVEAVCRPVFGSLPSPPASAFIGELGELDRVLLRIAVANTRRRPLLVVGNLEQLPGRHCRDTLLGRLADIGRGQTVITAAADEVSEGSVRAQIRVDDPECGEQRGGA